MIHLRSSFFFPLRFEIKPEWFIYCYHYGQVGLADKTNTAVKALSGGMKRKLSLGIALIGDSKVANNLVIHFVDFPRVDCNGSFYYYHRSLFLMNRLVEWIHTQCA